MSMFDTTGKTADTTARKENTLDRMNKALRRYQPDVKGHPPAEWLQPKPKEKKQP